MLPGSVFGEWLLCSNESGGALCGDLLFGAVAGRDGRRTEQRGAVVLGSGSRTFGGWAGAMESGVAPLEKDKRTYVWHKEAVPLYGKSADDGFLRIG